MSAAPSATLRRARRGGRRLVAERLPYLVLTAADLVVVWIAVQREAKISGLVTHGGAVGVPPALAAAAAAERKAGRPADGLRR
jgi:hypothetical protein